MNMVKGIAPTRHAEKYVQRLGKHWSHKFEVRQSRESCEITLPLGRVKLIPRSNELEIHLHPDKPENTEKMQRVLTEHLERFAFREAPLKYQW